LVSFARCRATARSSARLSFRGDATRCRLGPLSSATALPGRPLEGDAIACAARTRR
jgi:hypothetical protein